MKKIRIKFTDFWNGYSPENSMIVRLLKERYDVEFSETPDYIFCSCFGDTYKKYDGIRIFFTGECITPNFNDYDYGIGFDLLDFGDRYLRYPLYLFDYYYDKYATILNREPVGPEFLAKKTEFCNFVYSNNYGAEEREEFFHLLSKYKHVLSGGRWLNNVGGPVEDKLAFQSQCKFSIAFENQLYPGYTTEKLMDALAARTVPIYFGNLESVRDFNPKSYIHCKDFDSFEAVVERVKELDADDEAYLAMLNENPIPANPITPDDLKAFLYHIFDQDLADAKRRSTREDMLEKMRELPVIVESGLVKLRKRIFKF